MHWDHEPTPSGRARCPHRAAPGGLRTARPTWRFMESAFRFLECIGSMKLLKAWSPGFSRSEPFEPPEGGTPNHPNFTGERRCQRATLPKSSSVRKTDRFLRAPRSRPPRPPSLPVAARRFHRVSVIPPRLPRAGRTKQLCRRWPEEFYPNTRWRWSSSQVHRQIPPASDARPCVLPAIRSVRLAPTPVRTIDG